MLAATAGYAARPGSSPAPGGSRPIDLAGLVHTASASPADPIFMSYPNVPGESTDALHPNWIALNSWSFGVTKATTSAPTFTALTVTMPTSRATPPLFAAVTKGTVAATATLQAAKPIGTSDKNYLTVTLTNVRIGHWDDSQTAGIDSFTLSFTRFKIAYVLYSSSGVAVASYSACWDLSLHAAC